ncbi:MAG: hypothetical protein WC401_01745 [Bacteroidales bacterium]|jgi:hypothetical protein|nr:hypothetical protein [Bacteroidales bacterium]
MTNRKKKRFLKTIITLFVILLIIITLPYYKTKIYRFSEPAPFKGEIFYNPYENLKENWIKANFHAHSKTFGGITNGKNTVEEIIERYVSLGYNLIGISNYNQTTEKKISQKIFFYVYEHGYNLMRSHQLVINSEKPSYFDFPLFLSRSHKQYIINDIKKENNIIVLAHPLFKKGYSHDDLKYLVNYDCIEGVSPMAQSVSHWDYALSHGHTAWIMGNDDAHDITDGKSGVCWTMINADTQEEKTVMESLKRGSFYAVKGWLGQEMNRIKSVAVHHDTFELVLDKISDSIIIKSDWGKTVSFEINTDKITYKIKESDSYIRAEIFDTEPYNDYTKIYLNPVIRTNDNCFIKHNNTIQKNYTATIFFVVLLVLVHCTLIYLIFLLNFRKKKVNKFLP